MTRPEQFVVNTHPLKALAAVGAVVTLLLTANAFLTDLVVVNAIQDAIQDHTKVEHGNGSAVSQNSSTIRSIERDVAVRMGELRAVQSGFSSDIAWIKASNTRLNEKLDAIMETLADLERLSKRNNGTPTRPK